MPLQNRVAPDGSLHAVPERGTMLGNRGGKFHRDTQTLGKRRWASMHWICCELHFKGQHHEAMGRGYTSLFFLDEVTALAAGHRPCFFCRRKEAKAFLDGETVQVFDARLHAERLAPRVQAAANQLPDGAMVSSGTEFLAMRNGQFLRWCFSGYSKAVDSNPAMQLQLLTPPSILAILAKGYSPRWHHTAFQWDD